MSKSVLLLTLRTFSATGGIEKVCKVLGKSLLDLKQQGIVNELRLYSMYDHQQEVDDKYLAHSHFRGFNQQKIRFAFEAISAGRRSDVVMISHINLILIALLIKILSPKTRLVMLAHGIEVWNPLSSFKRWCLGKVDLTLAVSSFTREKMLELHHLVPERVQILNNCLDPYLKPGPGGDKDSELLRKTGFMPNDFVLITLTRLSSKERYKGYETVLQSVSNLLDRYPRLRYLIIGKFDELEVTRIRGIIEELGISRQVHLAGFIPDEQLASYFSLADLYIMPSKKEGFGIVFIEAMYYGLPVIAGNKDGSCDALLHGKIGTMVDPDDQQQINAAIEAVFENPGAFKPDQHLLEQHFGFEQYKKRIGSIITQLN